MLSQTADSVAPSSGSGNTQVFTAVYSDVAGASLLNRRILLINTSTAFSNACFVEVNQNGTWLMNDAGTTAQGPLTSTTTLTNSQCTLNSASSTISGNSSIVTVSVTFTAAFAGAKSLYIYANDTTGRGSGFQTAGAYTVTAPPAGPTADFITPITGSGNAQVFTAVYSDSSGGATLQDRLLLISPSLSGVNACSVNVSASGTYLMNDAGSDAVGTLTSTTPLSNHQCTLNSASAAVSGNSSTVTMSITFAPTFAGVKSLYIYANDTSGRTSGWSNAGTFTVIGPPTAVSVTPNAGAGSTQVFTAVYSDAFGASALNRRQFLINTSTSGTGACFVEVRPTGIYLANDANTAFAGPLTGAAKLSNSQCTVSGGGIIGTFSGISNSGNSSTVTLAIVFKPAFAGAKNIYLYADDANGNSGYQSFGTYTVSASSPGPTVDSVAPANASGRAQVFTAIYSDPKGAGALNWRIFLINSALVGASSCAVKVDPTGTYLVNDANTAFLGPLTSTGTLSNSQCTLQGAGTSVSNSAYSSIVSLAIVFNASFAGTKNIYLYVRRRERKR